MLDLERIRADTPATQDLIYLQNAGASPTPAPVLRVQVEHLALEARIGGYAAEEQARARLEAVYTSIARLVGAPARCIALAENATAAWQLAFGALTFGPGDRILTAESEYAANYVAYLQAARRTGVRIDVVPSDAAGQVDVHALEARIDARVKLIAITWVPSNGGLVNPAAAVGRIARAAGIPFLLDACQAVGQLPIDVEAIGCDFLAATGRKFLRGPRGTGFLYVRERWLDEGLEPHVLDHSGAPWVAADAYRLRPDARRFETWEGNRAAQLGLGAAVDYALALGLGEIHARCTHLAEHLRTALAAVPGVRVRDLGATRSAIVTFTAPRPAGELVAQAREHGIVMGVAAPDSTRLDAEARGLPPLVRVSPHYFNSEAELDRCVSWVDRFVRE